MRFAPNNVMAIMRRAGALEEEDGETMKMRRVRGRDGKMHLVPDNRKKKGAGAAAPKKKGAGKAAASKRGAGRASKKKRGKRAGRMTVGRAIAPKLHALAAGKGGHTPAALHSAVSTLARAQLATAGKVVELDGRVGALEGWMAGRKRLGGA